MNTRCTRRSNEQRQHWAFWKPRGKERGGFEVEGKLYGAFVTGNAWSLFITRHEVVPLTKPATWGDPQNQP